jgi:hypothetical protein
MLFVNNIGEVVHGMVDRFMGAANKVKKIKLFFTFKIIYIKKEYR